MEPKEIGGKIYPDPNSAQKVLSAPGHLWVFPQFESYHDETTIIFRLEMDVPIFFTTTCYNKQEEPVQNLEKVIFVSFSLKSFLFTLVENSQKQVLA